MCRANDLFVAYDVDASGTINTDEFRSIMRVLALQHQLEPLSKLEISETFELAGAGDVMGQEHFWLWCSRVFGHLSNESFITQIQYLINSGGSRGSTLLEVKVKAPLVECEVEGQVQAPSIGCEVELNAPSVECQVEVKVKAPSLACEVEAEAGSRTIVDRAASPAHIRLGSDWRNRFSSTACAAASSPSRSFNDARERAVILSPVPALLRNKSSPVPVLLRSKSFPPQSPKSPVASGQKVLETPEMLRSKSFPMHKAPSAKLTREEVQALTAVWRHLADDTELGMSKDELVSALRNGDHSFQDDPSFFENPVVAAEAMFSAMDSDGHGHVTCEQFLAFYAAMAETGVDVQQTIQAVRASVGYSGSADGDTKHNRKAKNRLQHQIEHQEQQMKLKDAQNEMLCKQVASLEAEAMLEKALHLTTRQELVHALELQDAGRLQEPCPDQQRIKTEKQAEEKQALEQQLAQREQELGSLRSVSKELRQQVETLERELKAQTDDVAYLGAVLEQQWSSGEVQEANASSKPASAQSQAGMTEQVLSEMLPVSLERASTTRASRTSLRSSVSSVNTEVSSVLDETALSLRNRSVFDEATSSSQTRSKGVCIHCKAPVLTTHKRVKCTAGYLHYQCNKLVESLIASGDIQHHEKVLGRLHAQVQSMEVELSAALAHKAAAESQVEELQVSFTSPRVVIHILRIL